MIIREILLVSCALTAAACRTKPAVAPATPSMVARPALAVPTCGAETGMLRGDRVGALRLRMSADSAKRLCHVVRDTFEMVEGDRERFLIVETRGDTLRAHVMPSGMINSIHLTSTRFYTSDSIRVGMPLGRLLSFKDLSGAYGEGYFVVWSESPSVCGLSFIIEFPRKDIFIRNASPETLQPYAETAKIKSAFARGC